MRQSIKCLESAMHAEARRNAVKVTCGGTMPRRVYLAATGMPGFTKFVDECLVFEATKANLRVWQDVVGEPIEDKDGTLAKLNVQLSEIQPYQRLLESPLPLMQHQRHALDVAMSRSIFAFWHDLGTGKSATIINIIFEKYMRGEIDRAVIITQERVKTQFRDEQVPLHLPYPTPVYSAAVWPLTRTIEKEWAKPTKMLRIVIASWGALQSSRQAAALRAFCIGGKTVMLCDEAHNAKSWSSARVDNLLKFIPHVPYRYLFSGNPCPLGPIDFFSQFFFLDENIIGHSGITSFRSQYCQFGGYENRVIVGYNHMDELTALLAPHSEYISIEDCRDMPERTWIESKFKPTQKQRDIYEQVREEFIAEVSQAINENETETLQKTCVNAASKLTTLRQIASGFFYTNEGTVAKITDERARFTIEEHVANAQGKVIIWAAFHADLDLIAHVLQDEGIRGVEISGRTVEKTDAYKRRFIDDPQCKVLFGTAASGGTGLDGLQCAQHMVFYNNSYNFGHRDQAERRIWRIGQSQRCVYTDILGFPVDRLVLKNLTTKQEMTEMVKNLTALAKMAEEI